MSIKGKVFKVIDNSWAEGLDSDGYGKNINLGDRVVALEESTVPWCVLESKFKGCLDVMKYNDDDVSLYYFENTDNRDEIVWIDEELEFIEKQDKDTKKIKEKMDLLYREKYPKPIVFEDGNEAYEEIHSFIHNFFNTEVEINSEFITLFNEFEGNTASFNVVWIENDNELNYNSFIVHLNK